MKLLFKSVKLLEMKLDFKPVDAGCWKDVETLFESRGGPHYCWCSVWRKNKSGSELQGKAGKKASLRIYVEEGIPVGILAYHDSVPIAWCAIAPRETLKKLGGDTTKIGVWGVTCFYVKGEYRGQGIPRNLLKAAMDYARREGARYVEAYPPDPESPSYQFMGYRPMFEEAGFQFIRKAGKRRNVMLLELTNP